MHSKAMHKGSRCGGGFTLIELSIVLVIIGLVVGGVLVGRDLIASATIRSQIAQIEKYQQATNTFRGKYGALPGDLPSSVATQFNFIARGQHAGQGDGNGIIEGVYQNLAAQNWGFVAAVGETATFWVDLTTAGLMDGSFTLASSTAFTAPDPIDNTTTPRLSDYFPRAKIGANSVYVLSDAGFNYFGITTVTSMLISGVMYNQSGLTVRQAYDIDTKIDDANPVTGRVFAKDSHSAGFRWTAAGSTFGCVNAGSCTADATTCMDNDGSEQVPWHYSLTINNGTNMNCSLVLRFQ